MPTPESSPEEFEASAKRYSNDCVIIVPLSSGRFGVFNNAREFHFVVDEASLASAVRAVPPIARRKAPKPSFSIISIGEELDL